MSLILEALRKSEAERRRAQAPDLFAPAQVAVAPARRAPLAWLAGGGTLALVVVALLLVRAFAPTPEQARPANAGTATDPPADARPAQAISAPATPTAPTSTAPRLLPAEEKPPAAVADASPSGPVPQAGNADAAIATTTGGEVAEAAPAAEPVAPPPPAPAASVPEPPPAADAGAPMRLSELGSEARRQLPPLKLTMHMWNEAAERRFVILDGHRLAEGDRIGALRVAEIRRDGVLLDWNGQRLELPLR
jgi:general secretion pathway protein B